MAHSTPRAGSKEKRHFARQATSQPARIRLGGAAAIPAEIRDFCETGLYVAFLGEGTPDAALQSLTGTPVQVEFSVAHSGAFQCHGRVARILPGGVGVLVSSMPEGALQALRWAGRRLARPVGSGLGAQQTQELLQECSRQFSRIFAPALQDFFQQAVERLGEACQDEPIFLERSHYDYAIQELQQQRSRIENEVFAALRDRIQKPDATESSARAPTNRLALVEEDEFEDWLNLSAVVKQIEAEILAPLHEVEQRYGRLVGVPVDSKEQSRRPGIHFSHVPGRHPGPGFLQCHSGGALQGTGTSALAPCTRALPATRADARIAAAGCVTAAGAHTPGKAKPAPIAKNQAELDLAEIAKTLDTLFKQDPAGTALSPESAEYSLDRILATLG